MNRVSDILKKIMLAILLAVMALAMTAMLVLTAESKSYLLTFALGLAWAGVLMLLCGKLRAGGFTLRGRVTPLKAGAWLTVLCFVINLAWVLAIRIEPFSDYDVFWQCARALAGYREISAPWYIATYPHILGTSTCLSLIVKLFGDSVLAVSVVNVVLTTATGVLIFLICLKITDMDTACIAFALWSLCPSKLMLNSLVFSEPWYTFMLMLFLYLLTVLKDGEKKLRESVAKCAIWGVILGLILRGFNILRPLASILLIAVFIWLIFLRGDRLKDGRAWRTCLVMLLVGVGVYSLSGKLWDKHVENVLGMEPASVPIYNMYVGFNEETGGQWSAEDMDLLFSHLTPGATPSQAQQAMLPHLKERIAEINNLPGLLVKKLVSFMGGDSLGGYTYRYSRSEMFTKIGILIGNTFYYGVFALAFAGFACMLKRDDGQSVVLLMPLYVLGLTLAHLLVEVTERYHYSIIPILVIFAAVTLSRARVTDCAHAVEAICK